MSKKRKKKEEKITFRNTRARGSLPPIFPVWCEWWARPCETHCGYCVDGRCAFPDSDEPIDLDGATIIYDLRDWTVQLLNEIKGA